MDFKWIIELVKTLPFCHSRTKISSPHHYTIRINLSLWSAKCCLGEKEMHDMCISHYHLFLLFNTWKQIILIKYPESSEKSFIIQTLCANLSRSATSWLYFSFDPSAQMKASKTVKKKYLSPLWLLLYQSAVKIRDETASSASQCSLGLSPSVCPSVAMQFGQLLTHLDTTQQMINNTLKDNNTLLAQVGSPASRLEHRWFRSQMTLQWQYNRGFWEGLGVMASAQMGNSKFWRMSLLRSVGLKQTEKSDLVTRHPFTLTYLICEPSAPIKLIFGHISFLIPPGPADDEGKPARYRRKLFCSRWENEEGF